MTFKEKFQADKDYPDILDRMCCGVDFGLVQTMWRFGFGSASGVPWGVGSSFLSKFRSDPFFTWRLDPIRFFRRLDLIRFLEKHSGFYLPNPAGSPFLVVWPIAGRVILGGSAPWFVQGSQEAGLHSQMVSYFGLHIDYSTSAPITIERWQLY